MLLYQQHMASSIFRTHNITRLHYLYTTHMTSDFYVMTLGIRLLSYHLLMAILIACGISIHLGIMTSPHYLIPSKWVRMIYRYTLITSIYNICNYIVPQYIPSRNQNSNACMQWMVSMVAITNFHQSPLVERRILPIIIHNNI